MLRGIGNGSRHLQYVRNDDHVLTATGFATVDRPLGSKHPEHDYVYPVNYGYVPVTVSGDGKELDAYVLGPDEPLETFTGIYS